MAYRAKRGIIPEIICVFYALCGFVFVVPIYSAILRSLIINGLDIISGTAMFCIFIMPTFITFTQSITSGIFYLLYIPYFIVLMVFYLVYLPTYSFARIWDT